MGDPDKKDPPDPSKGDPKPDPDDDLGDAGKRALREERTARREAERQLAEFKTRLQELEDKDKSELEKLRDKVADLEKDKLADAAKLLRAQVATDKGLTAA